MPSVQKINIHTQLIITFFVVMAISWILSSIVIVTTNRDAIIDYYRMIKKYHHIDNLPLPPVDIFFLNKLQMQVNNKLYNENDQTYNRKVIFIIRFSIALLISLIAGIIISKRYTNPLKKLSDGAKELHKGNFQHKIEINSKDEFGEMAQSMNEMAEMISTQINELKDESKRKKQLIADLAHELRSPIATQKTMLEAINNGLVNDEERSKKAIQSLSNNTERLEKLVDDLLVISRLDLDEFPLNKEISDINTVINDVIIANESLISSNNMSINLSLANNLLANIDKYRISQAIDNIVNNSLNYAGSGSVITIVTKKIAKDVTIEISDNGIGIPAEHQPYIFDSFYRVDNARTPGNYHNGLGLRIVKGIIEAHNGSINLTSDINHGTKTTIIIPA